MSLAFGGFGLLCALFTIATFIDYKLTGGQNTAGMGVDTIALFAFLSLVGIWAAQWVVLLEIIDELRKRDNNET